MSNNLDSNQVIYDAIRKIALRGYVNEQTGAFRNTERKSGSVIKIHTDPDDELCGTVDVIEFNVGGKDDGVHEGVLLSAIQDNKNGLMVIPMLYSEVVIAMDPVSHREYVALYSHVDVIQMESHETVKVGVTETKELQQDDDSPDFDELEQTGTHAHTIYKKNSIENIAATKSKQSSQLITEDKIEQKHGDAANLLEENKNEQKFGDKSVVVKNDGVYLGNDSATQAAVLGQELATFLSDFLDSLSKTQTTTALGPQPFINMAQYMILKSKVNTYKNSVSGFLSKTVKVKE